MAIIDLFRRSRNTSPEQESKPVEVEAGVANGQNDTSQNAVPVHGVVQFRSYEHGLVNGVLNVPEKPFMEFTAEFFRQADIENGIASVQEEVKRLSDEISKSESSLVEKHAELLHSRKSIQPFRIRKEYLESILDMLQARLSQARDHLKELKEKYVSDYTLLPAVFFLAAGLLFIVADYGLALTIIGDALKIGIETKEIDGELQAMPTKTTFLFAAALAALSFAIKPAYDRMIEKKYPDSNAVKRFNWSIIIVSILVLFMLFAMGMFREVVIGEGLRGQMNNQTFQEGVDNGAGVFDNAPAQPTTQSTPAATDDNENPLIHNPWALISIVLSTCLFALTGAICMGIAFPVLHKNARVFYNYLMQFIYRRRIFVVNRQLSPVKTKYESISLDIQFLENRVIDLQSDKEKMEQLNQLKKKLTDLIKEYFTIRTARANAIYTDGYERGKLLKDQLSETWAKEQILVNPGVNEDGNTYSGLSANGQKDASENGSLGRTRPFIAVRKMISGRFRRKFFDGPESNMEIN